MTLTRRLYALLALVFAAILFVAINIAADACITNAKLDLTQTGAYTLAQGTRNIIAKLQEPVTLKFFYSKQLAVKYPQINPYAGRVRDLLNEYAALSHGKIRLQEVDPEAYSPEEDEATADSLTGVPTESGEMIYFGLVGTNSIDGQEVIPFFNPEREANLEYDVSSLLYRLSEPRKHRIGIVSSLPLDGGGMAAMMGGGSQPLVLYQELSQNFDTEMLDPGFIAIPAGIDVLMIVHPPVLNQAQSYAIDQFVLGGGRALVFVDPYSELAGAGGQQGGAPPSSDLPQLLRAWGVFYDPDKVVVDRALAQRVQGNDPRNPIMSYPAWLRLTPPNFDSGDQITADLQLLNLGSTGALSPAKGATTNFTPLVSSSNEAGLVPAAQVRFNPRPQDLMNDIEPIGHPLAIAARISGPAKTAYPNGAAMAPGSAPQLMQSKGPINVVVMADSDIFNDPFWVNVDDSMGRKTATVKADNGAFVVGAVENLTGSGDLISLRTRATNDRPFVVVQQIQAAAEAQFQQEAEALQRQLQDTETTLQALKQRGTSKEQQAGIQRFERALANIRTQSREVQHNMRKDIDLLGAVLAWINIAGVPVLVSLFAVGLAVYRRRKRARAAVA